MKASTSMSSQATRIVTEASPSPCLSLAMPSSLPPPLRDQVEGIPLGILISWYSRLKHYVFERNSKVTISVFIYLFIWLWLLNFIFVIHPRHGFFFINMIYSFCGSLWVCLFAWSKRVHPVTVTSTVSVAIKNDIVDDDRDFVIPLTLCTWADVLSIVFFR